MTDNDRPRATLASVRLIGALAVAAFLFAAVMAGRAGDGAVALMYLFFAALGCYAVLGAGQVAADCNVVTVSNLLGEYELAWQRVRRVESSAYGTLVLHADDARLVLPPPLLWSGPRKHELNAMIIAQLRERSLVVTRSWAADYRTSKNVRVGRARAD